MSSMRATTRFLDLPTANVETAAAIFGNSDTCNTMKGQRNGVVRYLRDKQPNVIDLGCICHLENLAIKAAIKCLPVNIDAFVVDINTHFYLSVNRKQELKAFCEFVQSTYKQILAHVETRWLSLLRVFTRVLELWSPLVSYFTSHPEVEKQGRVKSIKERMCDEMRLYLLFLQFLLPTMNAFNVAFQATSHTIIHLLHPEMRKLTKRILRYFVAADKINLSDITATNYETHEHQLSNDKLEIGESAKALTIEMIIQGYEDVVCKFYDHVRLFFSALVRTLMKEFPFQSTLLSDMFCLNPKERHNQNFS